MCRPQGQESEEVTEETKAESQGSQVHAGSATKTLARHVRGKSFESP